MASPPATGSARRTSTLWHDGVPTFVRVLFIALVGVVVGLAVHGLIGLGGDDIHTALDAWVSCGAEWLVVVLCGLGARRSERNRGAWALVTVAVALWALGDTIWSIRGEPESTATISDFFWLLWYPLLIAALILLVRDRVPRFELHRWIDGIIVMLVVSRPGSRSSWSRRRTRRTTPRSSPVSTSRTPLVTPSSWVRRWASSR